VGEEFMDVRVPTSLAATRSTLRLAPVFAAPHITRFEVKAQNFLAFIKLRCVVILLRRL
jgi:hypothetical protein